MTMDVNSLALYIHELRNQCAYSEAAVGLLNQSLEQNSGVGVFFAIQNLMTSAAQVSRLLWPQKQKAKDRGELLRKTLQLPAEYDLHKEQIHNFWDQADSRTDKWISGTKEQKILFDFVGQISTLEPQPAIANIYRAYDLETKTYYYRGEAFDLQAIITALANVNHRVVQAHEQLFPDQNKAQSPDQEKANPTADTKEK